MNTVRSVAAITQHQLCRGTRQQYIYKRPWSYSACPTIEQTKTQSYLAYPVQIGLGVLGEVKVDDNIDSLNVNTPSEEICTSISHV